MNVRLLTFLVGSTVVMTLQAGVRMNGLANIRTVQAEIQGVTIQRLAQTLPLPFASEPTTASLKRMVLEPGATFDFRYRGPVLFYVEQGTLGVDLKNHQLAIVRSDDGATSGGDRGLKRGNIPSGYGIYSADGDTGPFANAGDGDVVVLAVLFVPQPSDSEVESGGGSATVIVDPATPTP